MIGSLVGVLPAAGRGMRADPATRFLPKGMLNVGGVPILRRSIELMRDQLLISEIRIVVGEIAEPIIAYFGDGRSFGVRIEYVMNPRIDLELPYSIYLATRDGDETLCVVLSDECYFGSNHQTILDESYAREQILCGSVLARSLKEVRKNYSFRFAGERVSDLLEKPDRPSELAMGTGTFLLRADVIRSLRVAFSIDIERGPRDWVSWLGSECRRGVPARAVALGGTYVNINALADLTDAEFLLHDCEIGASSELTERSTL